MMSVHWEGTLNSVIHSGGAASTRKSCTTELLSASAFSTRTPNWDRMSIHDYGVSKSSGLLFSQTALFLRRFTAELLTSLTVDTLARNVGVVSCV